MTGTNKAILACTAGAAASLYFVYAASVVLFVQHLDLTTVTALESLIIATQAARLAGAVAYYGTRPPRFEVLLVLLSLETFVVMGLIVTFVVLGVPILSVLAHTIFSTWIASLFTVLPSYLIFVGIVQMARGKTLLTLLPLALEFGLLLFVVASLQQFVGTYTFASFFDYLLSTARSGVGSGAIEQLSSLAILVPSVVLYLSMLVYAAVPTPTGALSPRVSLVLPLFSAAVALGWVYGSLRLLPNGLLSFTVPGVAVVILLWAYARR